MNRISKVRLVAAPVAVLLVTIPAAAALQTSLNYSCGGPSCSIGAPINLIQNDGSLVSIGDGVGGASGQAAYGLLKGGVTGVWVGDFPPTYAGGGEASSNAVDTITLSGGTGNVNVTVTMNIDGIFAGGRQTSVGGVGTAAINASIGLGPVGVAGVNVDDNSGQGTGFISLNCTVTCQWASADGVFTSSGSLTLTHRPAATGSLVATFTVPYDTPLNFGSQLDLTALSSGTVNATASVTLSVPPGTIVTSGSGASYIATAQSANVPIPEWAAVLLGAMLLAIVQRRCCRRRSA